MATSEMIEAACRTDEQLFKAPLNNPVAAGHIIGEREVEADPGEQALAARWLRRERPPGWRKILQALNLPAGGGLTPWQDNPGVAAVCLAEARADETPAPVLRLAPEAAPVPAPALQPRSGSRRRPVPRRSWGWQDDAACEGESLVLFFGPDGERQPERAIRERKAKAVCAQCPVRAACLAYALAYPEKTGTWGGLNEDERASERRRRMRRAASAGVGAQIPHAVPPISGFKRCQSCRALKSVDEFGRDVEHDDGLQRSCKDCINAAARRRRETKRAVAS